jgi:ligand-binding sensor domain-containing protein/signal transduction histidine kinase
MERGSPRPDDNAVAAAGEARGSGVGKTSYDRHRSMARPLLALALILFCPALVFGASSQFLVDCWHPEEGLPNNALSDVIQARDGYLWIATWAGAVRFDGVRFTPVLRNLPNDHVRALLETSNGTMWVSVSGAGLVRLRDGRVDHIFTTADGLAGADVRAIVEDARGRIWAGTEAGLSVIDGNRIRTIRRAQGLNDDVINALRRGAGGRVWIATASGICSATDDGVECDAADAGRGRSVLEDRSGVLWIGTDAGLTSKGAHTPCEHRCFPGQRVSSLLESRDGSVWAGFGDGGVARIAAGVSTLYGAGTCLPTGGPVVRMHEDAEGSIWVATYNAGLGRLKPARVVTYAMADGLPNKVIGSIVEDARGTIRAGTQCGPVSELRGGRFVPRFQEYTKDACAWVLWPARDGSLWIGTRGNGVFRWRAGRMQHIGVREGLSDARISGLFEDRDGTMWIGTEFGGLHTFANGRLSRSFDADDGVATGFIASFAQDRSGRIWIGSNATGLSIYEDGRFRRLGDDERPPTNNIAGLFVDSRGDLWIGSAADGLFRYRNGRYEPFGPAQGLGDRLVAVMVEGADGAIWVHTANGISRLERSRIDAVAAGRAASLEPLILGRAEGLRTLEGSGGGLDPSGLTSRDGRLWFSTVDGIVVIDPATFATNRVPPKLAIEQVRVGGRPAEAKDGSIRVPAGTQAMEVDYTALSLLLPARVKFKYRLVGADTAWQDAGTRRTAYYTRLSPGRYQFEVLAANDDGLWATTPAALALVVAPFWWERLSVQFLGVALLLAATGAGVRSLSLRRARARVAELEREQALNRERSRIARDLHDDLGSRLAQIKLIADRHSTDSLGRISDVATDAMQTMDELVWTVNAGNDSVESFAQYAAEFVEQHLSAAGLRFRLRVPGDLGDRPLNADARRNLFLAFKETLHNVVKHAGATEVHVRIDVEGADVVVEVSDNGCGLPGDGAGMATGNGLRNIRERARATGGTVTFGPAPGGGTRVTLRIPFAAS